MAIDRTNSTNARRRGTVGPAVGGAYVTAVAARTTAYATWLWALALGALTLDAALTVVGLRLGLTELNPVAAGLIADVGALPALVALKGGAVGVGLAGRAVLPAEYRGLVPAGLALPWTVAVVVNLLTVGVVLL
ncbi:hypothetical protein EI982_03925 [Haloplanus rallus]|uniref:DUF5658 domain-containing protein n=1 Tax=Haloplanus rallus TaxID=1816183 RepID=A0A6B9F6F0_9EURY|nr:MULTISPECIES: hypothetical protein [Haloplanus]QGX93987.1 hypothetical protein EI982_03925 [Haloplanus rallus]